MKHEKPCENRQASFDMRGLAEEEKRVRPFLGWTSLGLSVASPLAAGGIVATGPHENFVPAILGLLLCVVVSVLGVLAGIIGLRRREQPKYPALAGITVGAVPVGILLLCLLIGRGCRMESGF